MSKTSGSSKRQRQLILTARVDEREKRLVVEKAKAYGGISALFRVAVLNAKPRPSQIDKEAFAQALAEIGKLRSELNKIGSNLNQLTHYANAGRTLEASIQYYLHELNEFIERDLLELRTMLMRALGFERGTGPPVRD